MRGPVRLEPTTSPRVIDFWQCRKHGTLWLMDSIQNNDDGADSFCTPGIYDTMYIMSQVGLAQFDPPFLYEGYFSSRSGVIIAMQNRGWSSNARDSPAADDPRAIRAPDTWAEAMYSVWEAESVHNHDEPHVLQATLQAAVHESVTMSVMQEINNNVVPLLAWNRDSGRTLHPVPQFADPKTESADSGDDEDFDMRGSFYKMWQFFPGDADGHFYALIGTPRGADGVQLLYQHPSSFATVEEKVRKVKTVERVILTQSIAHGESPSYDLAFMYIDVDYEQRTSVSIPQSH